MKKLIVKSLFSTFLVVVSYWPIYAKSKQTNDLESTDTDFNEPMDEEIEDEFGSDEPMSYPSLIFDWALTSLQQTPQGMELKFWRSRIANGGFFYNIPISTSHFMVGFGGVVGNADYMFNKNRTLTRKSDNRRVVFRNASDILPGGVKVYYTMFTMNHADAVIEFRFNSDKDEPHEGFFIAVGGYIGFQFLPSMTLHYKEDDEDKTQIIKESFNHNKFRYGAVARIGWSRFGLVYTQGLSNIFNNNKENGISNSKIWPWTAGISINLL